MQHRLATTVFCLIAPFGLVLAGCPGDLESPDRFAGQFGGGGCPDIEMDIIPKDCAKASCHSGSTPMGSLDLSGSDIVTQLSNKKCVGDPKVLLIDTANPAKSALYTKITASPPFGAQMPFATTKLDEATQACFLSWLEDSVKGKTTSP
jgi:hypothetical protein